MGSGCSVVEETVNYLVKQGQKVGLVKVRLTSLATAFLPFFPSVKGWHGFLFVMGGAAT